MLKQLRNMLSTKNGKSMLNISSGDHELLRYAMSNFRFHNDVRSPSKSIVIHDFLSSSENYQQVLHHQVTREILTSMFLYPLEIYSVDLRGHNLSYKLNPESTSSSLSSYALTSGIDVVQLQKCVQIHDAMVIGVNFGAMVACHAALIAPEAFSGLTLFIDEITQLMHFVPSSYALFPLLKSLPNKFNSLTELNELLKERIPNSIERMNLLSNTERDAAGVHLRYNKSLFALQEQLSFFDFERNTCFDKPVHIYVREKSTPLHSQPSTNKNNNDNDNNSCVNAQQQLPQKFMEYFPQCTIKHIDESKWNMYLRFAPIPSGAISQQSIQEVQQFLCEEEQQRELHSIADKLRAM